MLCCSRPRYTEEIYLSYLMKIVTFKKKNYSTLSEINMDDLTDCSIIESMFRNLQSKINGIPIMDVTSTTVVAICL